ncbi:MAG TPA: phage portal protein [Azospirillum sp.]|nr:phage portal protein [Azospirillum sp.]
MGLLNSAVAAVWGVIFPRAGADQATPGPIDDFWYGDAAGASHAGIQVTPDVAIKASAVYACVKVLAETIATLPLNMYRRRPDGGLDDADDHPLEDLLAYQPNDWQTAVEFWEMLILHAALIGQGLAEIVPGPRGAVDRLLPLRADLVITERLPNGRLRFRYFDPNQQGRERVLLQDEVFRIPGMSSDGIRPLRAVDLAAEAIGLGMAADAYAARVFSNNLNLGAILVHPSKLSEEGQKNLIHALMMRFAGVGNAHRPIVLQEGMKVEKVSQTAEQAQLLEARKWQIGEVARYWRIPLHMLGIYDGATHSNVEQQALDLVKYTLRPWVRRIELAIRRDLITAKQLYVAEFDMEGLLRGDAASRAEYYAKALGSGGHPAWLTPNEIRRLEGYNPKPGGDDLPTPANAAQAGQPRAADAGRQAVGRLVAKEIAAIRKASMRFAADPDAFRKWVDAFYGGHVADAMRALNLPREAAKAYCAHAAGAVKAANDVAGLLDRWDEMRVAEVLAALEVNDVDV